MRKYLFILLFDIHSGFHSPRPIDGLSVGLEVDDNSLRSSRSRLAMYLSNAVHAKSATLAAMTQTIELCAGQAGDAATISALAIQVFLDTYATEGIRPELAREALREYCTQAFECRLCEAKRRFLLAMRGDALLGFAELHTEAQAAPAGNLVGAELIRLYVQPAMQGQGIGGRLLRAAEQLAQDADARSVWLTVWSGNHRAQKFYARKGYTDLGETKYAIEGVEYSNRVLANAKCSFD